MYDRSIIDYHIGLECTAKQAAQALQRALFKRQWFNDDQRKLTIRSDNAPPFTSLAYGAACDDFGVEHERILPKKCECSYRIVPPSS
ncbi:hypothetical protein [Halobacillus seohaensis]|uniref:Transposase n=1 Tax=Halobacillus seohaensis TaxID=447421 RepID=A0ABW2EFJ0_9BACI